MSDSPRSASAASMVIRYPYLWLDARATKMREVGRVVPGLLLHAIAVNERGEREVLGCTVAARRVDAINHGPRRR